VSPSLDLESFSKREITILCLLLFWAGWLALVTVSRIGGFGPYASGLLFYPSELTAASLVAVLASLLRDSRRKSRTLCD
jgi:hypothetical protein